MRIIAVICFLFLFSRLSSQDHLLNIDSIQISKEVIEIKVKIKVFKKSKIYIKKQLQCFDFGFYYIVSDSLNKPLGCFIDIKGCPIPRREFATIKKGSIEYYKFDLMIEDIHTILASNPKYKSSHINIQICYDYNMIRNNKYRISMRSNVLPIKL